MIRKEVRILRIVFAVLKDVMIFIFRLRGSDDKYKVPEDWIGDSIEQDGSVHYDSYMGITILTKGKCLGIGSIDVNEFDEFDEQLRQTVNSSNLHFVDWRYEIDKYDIMWYSGDKVLEDGTPTVLDLIIAEDNEAQYLIMIGTLVDDSLYRPVIKEFFSSLEFVE